MLGRVFFVVVFFSSLGVFIKLKKYGAPNSSIFYAIGLPGATFILSALYGFKEIRQIFKKKKVTLYTFTKVYVIYLIRCLKSVPLMTGIMCVQLGKRKIGMIDVLDGGIINLTREGIKKVYKIIIKNINIYNISVEKHNLYLRKI